VNRFTAGTIALTRGGTVERGDPMPVARLLSALAVAFAVPILVWFWLYPTFGYGPGTLRIAQVLILLAAVGLIGALRLPVRDLGLGASSLRDAAAIGAVAYAGILLVAAGLNVALETEFALFRGRYEAGAFVDNWLLTAVPESLLFAGVLYHLVRERTRSRRAWVAVGLVAAAFALWHLPGYLAIGYGVGAIAGRMALNVASWLIFGTAYAVSGNLWLVVVAHAATDYGLSPLVTNEPAFGLLFMALLVAGAYGTRSRRATGAAGTGAAGPGAVAG
jgi:membrane protease YdiL (CAAX protease family)